MALRPRRPSPAPPSGKNTKKTKQTTEEPLPHVPVTTTKNTIQTTTPQADQHVVNFCRVEVVNFSRVSGLMVGSLLFNALVVLMSALAMDPTDGMSRDAMIGVGATGGVLLLGSVPAWIMYAASGSSTLALEDPGFDLGGRVVVTPGAVVLPWPADTPAFALGLHGTWGGFRAPHERRADTPADP